MTITKITYEVRHDYGDYTHTDAIDCFDTYEEAKALFDECIAPSNIDDEWDDAFELNKVTEEFETEEDAECNIPIDGEMETLEWHVINEYVDHDWR